MLRHVRIGARLHLIVVVMLAAIGLVAWSALTVLQERLREERRVQCRTLVQSALGHLRHLHAKVEEGALSPAEARAAAIAAIAAMSLDNPDYLWVNDVAARVVWHPRAELVGRDMADFREPGGKRLFAEFVARTAAGGAFVSYRWPRPGEHEPLRKLSYVERFEPWGWVIGSGIYMDDIDRAVARDALDFGLTAVLTAFAGSLVALFLGAGITNPLHRLAQSMTRLAEGGQDAVAVPETDRRDELGDLTRAMAVFKTALAEREQARQERDRMLSQAAAVFDTISEGVVVTDAANRIVMVNPSFTRITGYEPDEVVGQTPAMLSSGRHDAAFYAAMWEELARVGRWQGEIWNRNKKGDIYPEFLSIAALPGPGGRPDGYVGTFLDITDSKRRESRIRWRADHDSLTGLANRAHFEARLAESVRLAQEEGCVIALLYIDLDRFKPVNDRLGHAAGDAVLRNAARRIRRAIRSGDTAARLGGDEFAVIVTGLGNPADAEAIAAKLGAALDRPFTAAGEQVRLGASIGVALYPQDGANAEELLAAADAGMYRQKRAGRAVTAG